jgi:hypothetical protein
MHSGRSTAGGRRRGTRTRTDAAAGGGMSLFFSFLVVGVKSSQSALDDSPVGVVIIG